MAVYVVSLSQLVNRRHPAMPPAAAVTQAVNEPVEQGLPALPTNPEVFPHADRHKPLGSPRRAVEGPLGSPGSQIDGLANTGGESCGEAILSLIYRMSRLEARLEEVGALLQGRVLPVSMPLDGPEHHEEAINPAHSGLLEQLFRKNILLRRKD